MANAAYTGKYRYTETWIGSSDGLHETLVSEGRTSSGRNWAFLKLWTKRPRYRDEEGIKYVLRIDISEWWNVYRQCYQEFHEKKLLTISNLNSLPIVPNTSGGVNNRSPGWWDNGFGVQMCYSYTVVKYKSIEERFEQIIKYGFDFDSFDMGVAVEEICSKLMPMFNFFRSVGRPNIPGNDF